VDSILKESDLLEEFERKPTKKSLSPEKETQRSLYVAERPRSEFMVPKPSRNSERPVTTTTMTLPLDILTTGMLGRSLAPNDGTKTIKSY
jgi:hypothetical protein